MICNKTKTRTILNLFEVLTCTNCNHEIIYEYIYIGNNIIHIYKFNKECLNSNKKMDYLNLFFKEGLINNKGMFIILEENEFIRYFDMLPLFIDDNDVFVFII